MARRTRAEQVEANREAILDAAKAHISASGYHGASLDAIADAAGFSKGAIYSQFGSKDDMMLAVLERNIARRRDSNADLLVALGDELRPDDVLRHFEAGSRDDRGWQTALIEFRIHASRNAALNDRYRRLHEQTLDALTETCAAISRRLGLDPRVSPRSLALATFTTGLGVVVEDLATDDLDVVELARAIAAMAPAAAPRGTTDR